MSFWKNLIMSNLLKKVASDEIKQIVKLTQEDYDSLSEKNALTLYIIIEDVVEQV